MKSSSTHFSPNRRLNLLQVLVEQVVIHVDVLRVAVQIFQVVGKSGIFTHGIGQVLQVLLLDVVGRLRIVVLVGVTVRVSLVGETGLLEQILLRVQNGGHSLELIQVGQTGVQLVLVLELEVRTPLGHVLDDLLTGSPRAIRKSLELGVESGTVLGVAVKLGSQQQVFVGDLELQVGELHEVTLEVLKVRSDSRAGTVVWFE